MEYLPNNQQIETNEPLKISPEVAMLTLAAVLAVGLLMWLLWPRSGTAVTAPVGEAVRSGGMSVADMAEMLR
jgi:hypothetical protein